MAASQADWDAPAPQPLTMIGRIPNLYLGALLAALAIIWLAALLLQGGSLDGIIFNQLYAANRPAVVTIARVITYLGTRPVIYPVLGTCALLLAWQRRFCAAIVLVVSPVAARIVIEWQKEYFSLARPPHELHLVHTHTFAFPSGHTANAMVAYLGLALLFAGTQAWRRWAVAAAIAVSGTIGITRVMLGVHWPTDVIGGWAFGAFWTLGCIALAEAAYARSGLRAAFAARC